ncbi:hypothetical protein E2R56_07880 [Rhodococcus qingshengii]|nr:hypothetical protein E2R56_07880 [Rhodococcus qingshengii]
MVGYKPHSHETSTDDNKAKKTLKDIILQACKSSDFHQFSPVGKIKISYYKSLINEDKINRYLIQEIQKNIEKINDLEDIKNIFLLMTSK